MEKTTAIILAAGLSLRMGCNKLLLPLGGKSMLQYCIDLVLDLPVDERILVTTPTVFKEIRAPMQVVFNPTPEVGQSSSMHAGVGKAKEGNSLLFFTGDQPLLTRETVEEILAADNGKSIVFPLRRDGRPGSPTLFAPCFRSELLQVSGDQGGRALRRAFPHACRGIAIRNPHELQDVDTREDYQKIVLSFSQP